MLVPNRLSWIPVLLRSLEILSHLAGIRDRFAGRFYDLPHAFSRTMQADARAWFDRHLKV